MGLKGATKGRQLFGIQGVRRQLLKRTEPDAVCLAQGSIYCSGFSHAHLGVVEDQGRDVPRVGIAIADEATALGGLVDGGLEDPEILLGTTNR